MDNKYLKKDEIVCGLCRIIHRIIDSNEYIKCIEWGSVSGKPIFDNCCKKCYKNKINPLNKQVLGRAYA